MTLVRFAGRIDIVGGIGHAHVTSFLWEHRDAASIFLVMHIMFTGAGRFEAGFSPASQAPPGKNATKMPAKSTCLYKHRTYSAHRLILSPQSIWALKAVANRLVLCVGFLLTHGMD